MKLAFLKIDNIVENLAGKIIEIPSGGIQFEHKGQVIQSVEPVEIKMTHRGMFQETLRKINFAVYTDLSIFASSQIMHEPLFGILAHEDVQRAIYSEIAKRCKIVPMHKSVDERELFAREYETAYAQLLGV